jgi:hypothetical protein
LNAVSRPLITSAVVFEERLRFGLVYFLNVAAQMIDQFAEFVPNVRGMRSGIF